MQPTSRVGGFEAVAEPTDVFCGLASLIVEGRIPRKDGRGYGEGPHVPQTGGTSKAFSRHECSTESYMCKKDENFRKHMLLLWQNNVPVSIEVLLCSNCRVSQQKINSVEFSTIPEPGSILLEQWTVSIHSQRPSSDDCLFTSQGLFQAVRSYLHFSQLSAWYSSSRGQEPQNVLYRITIPGENFASKFSCKPEEHLFPSANVGRMSAVHVSVRYLPRCEEVPRVTCPHNVVNESPVVSPAASVASSSSLEVSSDPDQDKLSMAGALEWKCAEPPPFGANIRKALLKAARLHHDCQEKLPRSDSMDSMLGDSLLDPPQSLQKMPPKRYQSPSRCGSPSLEAPDHLLFGIKKENSSSVDTDSHQSRLARQDLLRRRDINMYSSLHPRLLHMTSTSGQSPLSPKATMCKASLRSPQQPYRAFHVPQMPSTYEKAAAKDPENLGAKRKNPPLKLKPSCNDDYEEDEEDGEAEDGMLPPEFEAALSSCSSRRSSIKESTSEDFCKKKPTSSTLEDILGIHPDSQIFTDPDLANTRVYRAEIPPLPPQPPPILPQQQQQHEEMSKSDILLGALLRTCERNRHLEEAATAKSSGAASRLRTMSDNPNKLLEPLDMTFSKDWSEDDEEDEDEEDEESPEEVNQSSRRSSFSSDANYVPTPDECASFRQSFDSATSMVFHRRTGLPLTSSPAPLRRGKDKFDFDESIHSPHDIKKALFAKKSLLMKIHEDKNNNKENSNDLLNHQGQQPLQNNVNAVSRPTATIASSSRQRRPSKKLLSASAPATLTSNNLLGNFEESVLNGRLEPNSTVEGFTAEIGASGSFHPKHKTLPVTVFFYTLCDNAAYSSPYLGHINIGKKGYRVPPKGTIQVTLFNPLGTVVKMFVVMYDLSDMPPNSQTFLRQRTLYTPSEGVSDSDMRKWLRYLIHLRFASSNSGKIYLHTDIRMIIFRKSDLDTAADFTSSKGFELRSFTQGPSNPKFSPRR